MKNLKEKMYSHRHFYTYQHDKAIPNILDTVNYNVEKKNKNKLSIKCLKQTRNIFIIVWNQILDDTN